MKVGYPNLPPGISKIAIGSLTRNSAGNQAVTGLGFAPKVISFFGYSSVSATDIQSRGFDNVASHYCIYKFGGTEPQYSSAVRSIVVGPDTSNFIRGFVASMDADGFTITWDLTGIATADVIYLAMR